jgi:hypothetical protein
VIVQLYRLTTALVRFHSPFSNRCQGDCDLFLCCSAKLVFADPVPSQVAANAEQGHAHRPQLDGAGIAFPSP